MPLQQYMAALITVMLWLMQFCIAAMNTLHGQNPGLVIGLQYLPKNYLLQRACAHSPNSRYRNAHVVGLSSSPHTTQHAMCWQSDMPTSPGTALVKRRHVMTKILIAMAKLNGFMLVACREVHPRCPA